eukprot:GHVT01045655.1.p3 GENE.GHVT01045655.1~~GHVT01045655.1.p3  ORF type:complete len:108 (+),score=26.81 GHVT01045655.1:572-895(+)
MHQVSLPGPSPPSQKANGKVKTKTFSWPRAVGRRSSWPWPGAGKGGQAGGRAAARRSPAKHADTHWGLSNVTNAKLETEGEGEGEAGRQGEGERKGESEGVLAADAN